MNIQELRMKTLAIHDKAKEENRSLNSDEQTQVNNLLAEIQKQGEMQKIHDEVAEQFKREQDALEREKEKADSDGLTPSQRLRKSCNSFAIGNYAVGASEFETDVVKQFGKGSALIEVLSPERLIRSNHGRTYSIGTIASGTGESRTEGQAGSTNSDTVYTSADLAVVTYSGQQIQVTNEMLEDAEFPVEQELVVWGMDNASRAFDAARTTVVVSALSSNTTTIDEGSDGILDLYDLVKGYIEDVDEYAQRKGNVAIMANKTQVAEWRTHKDLNGRPDYNDWLAILGINKVVMNSNLSDGKAIVGNFDEGLAVRVVNNPSVYIYPTSGGDMMEVRMRAGAIVRNPQALRYVQASA